MASAPARQSRSSTILHTVLILSAVYVGVPLYFYLFPSHGVSAIPEAPNVTQSIPDPSPVVVSVPTPTVSASTPPSSAESHAMQFYLSILLTTARYLIFGIWAAISYLPHLTVLLVVPAKYLYHLATYVVLALANILYPVVAPVILGLQVLSSLVLGPVYFVGNVASALYPLYVFLGAAATCGAVLGFCARWTSGFVLESVIGIRSQAKVEVEASTTGKRRDSGPARRVRMSEKSSREYLY